MQTFMDNKIKTWVDGVSFDDNARIQVENVAKMPFIYKHVAILPDVHFGVGATVGSVIATRGAIIPAAVGVDIGCGIAATLTNLTANDLPFNLNKWRTLIESAVPHGRTNNGQKGDRGAWHNIPTTVLDTYLPLAKSLGDICEKHPKIVKNAETIPSHLGTLGSGNHFIEVCLDEQGRVWVMLHSGSRGIGNRIGTYFIEKAKEQAAKYFYEELLPDKDLAYLVEGTPIFNDYCEGVQWAQEYAAINRNLMMQATLNAIGATASSTSVSCHHNYVSRENHFGANNVIVTRKGAVSAKLDQLGIIPGSMGTKSFIVKGKGNRESFTSCSHGAGRVMGRNQARKNITQEQFEDSVKGVECRRDADVIDEAPQAYKDIDAVMKAQEDLVDIVHTLKQVLVVKG